MRDPGGPLIGSPGRHGRFTGRQPRDPPASGRGPAPPVLGAAGSHATSAGISYPHCSFKELRMRRRQFIAGLGGAAAWPIAARAQQPALPVIGLLNPQSADDDYTNHTIPFLRGLKEAGYVEGQSVAIEYRWAENQYDRLPALAADLVRRRVAVIVASGTAPALAAKAATTTIPIVFSTAGDPVALGIVASLNRPGANVTGMVNLTAELAPKQLQLLRELKPDAGLFGVLADPAFPTTQSTVAKLQAAARTLGLQLIV